MAEQRRPKPQAHTKPRAKKPSARRILVDTIVLRSGYLVSLDEVELPAVIKHLQNAIVGESIAAVGRKRRKSWERVVEEIVGEIAHLTKDIRPDAYRPIVAALLYERAIEHLHTIMDECEPEQATKLIQ